MTGRILVLIGTAAQAYVAWSDGRVTQNRSAAQLGRGNVYLKLLTQLKRPRSTAATIAVASSGTRFSQERALVATANSLAFAWGATLVRVPVPILPLSKEQLAMFLQQLPRGHRQPLAPTYAAPPNITLARPFTGTHINAGGLVYDPAKKALLFVQRLDNHRVGAPKGHKEPQETILQAAEREIGEETGIVGLECLGRLPSVTYLSDDHGKLPKKIPHHLHHFLFLRKSKRTISVVKTGEVANLRLLWYPASSPQPPAKLHADLKPVFTQAVAILRAKKLLSRPSGKK
ncbi:MAG: NUDIX domain-containing protein [Patescibacteria group bacterium]|jgi:8-oxo-dGTP pyrophosphatase MutT (NUDIX family)